MERWKDVIGYEKLYKVSSDGRMWSCIRNKAMALKINKGYFMVNLSCNGKIKTYSVHRLVAMAFIENQQNKREVNHIDENKLNNNIDNLQWATSKENANWGTRNNRISEYVKNNPQISSGKRKRKVEQIDLSTGKVIARYDSISDVAKKFKYHQGNISSCCSGKINKANGYSWRFAS